MCLSPIHISSRKRRLGFGDSFLHDVPCGHCSECLELKKSEYYLRAYYTFQECLSKGGYMLFDTLTYDDAHLPHVSDIVELLPDCDFSCFNPDHYRKFFKLLRIRLHRLGFANGSFKYFLSSEYGSRKEYVTRNGLRRLGTQRPHHHVLFFVTDPTLRPEVLSRAVSDAWLYGRTDGIAYKGFDYLYKERVYGLGYNCDPSYQRNVCMYVAKYVNKDSDFQKELDSRVYALCVARFGAQVAAHPTTEVSAYMRKLKRVMSPFSRHSHDFGAYALEVCDMDFLMDTGTISVPDSKFVVKNIRLPMYLSRRAFYKLELIDGRRQWRLNDLGKVYKKKRMLKVRDFFVRRFDSFLKTLDDSQRILIREYLDGRSVKDFADYLFFYRHRLIPLDVCNEIPQVPEILDLILTEGQDVFNNYNTSVDLRLLGERFVDSHPYSQLFVEVGENYSRMEFDIFSEQFVSKKDNNHISDFFFQFCVHDAGNGAFPPTLPKYKFNRWCWRNRRRYGYREPLVSHMKFLHTHCYNEDSCLAWRNFDTLYSLYCGLLTPVNDRKQNAYEVSQSIYKRLKSKGLLTKKI